MTNATCTSTDPTNHQGDTCPIHEQEVTLSLYEPELDIMAYDEAADRSVTIAIMGDELTPSERKHYAELIVKAVNAHGALVAALTLIAYRYESGDIGDLVNDMPEIEAALGAVK